MAAKAAEKNRPQRREMMFPIQAREQSEDNEKMIVEGRAVTFASETVLFEMDGIEYKEEIDPHAFDDAKMDDVIFNYNHAGKVMARTRNKTLSLEVREDGLYMTADLSGTEEGRRLYEEIRGGYIDRMSFAFTTREESYDNQAHKWTVLAIKRLYDVSAVAIPAYDDTSIEARKTFILEAEAQAKREREAAADIQRRKLILKAKISQMTK